MSRHMAQPRSRCLLVWLARSRDMFLPERKNQFSNGVVCKDERTKRTNKKTLSVLQITATCFFWRSTAFLYYHVSSKLTSYQLFSFFFPFSSVSLGPLLSRQVVRRSTGLEDTPITSTNLYRAPKINPRGKSISIFLSGLLKLSWTKTIVC